jgi:hypothetical protein
MNSDQLIAELTRRRDEWSQSQTDDPTAAARVAAYNECIDVIAQQAPATLDAATLAFALRGLVGQVTEMQRRLAQVERQIAIAAGR